MAQLSPHLTTRNGQDVIAARKGDFESRMVFASHCKQQGDDRFVTGEFSDAINEYERSLSVFFWVEPRSSNWTKEVLYTDFYSDLKEMWIHSPNMNKTNLDTANKNRKQKMRNWKNSLS